MKPRKPYPTDISDEEWAFAVPYLTLMDAQAPQRKYALRAMFNALRWIARAGAPWRLLPNDFPPWKAVYQQTQRWLQAGCFKAMVSDLRSLLRVAHGKKGQPSAVIFDGRTLQSTCESGPRADTMATNARKGARCTWRSIRWDTCSPSKSRQPMSKSARRSNRWLKRYNTRPLKRSRSRLWIKAIPAKNRRRRPRTKASSCT
ncbi:hypothetical protein CFBP7900_32000 [Xanthomonas hortorum pv. carotae]|uniref:Insertion element IS402-like domain-containing protein n=1 Tax=Xanthomonas hortorum pv. carotae TaxID=487904 RepID=A0A6V7FAD1_9XANT|nr:hypothetical protein CFBP7900_32000 [Xanthomonas hortorum pv. carotae]CAD0360338.1 hypothetical protein CFBP7900_32000 [Xanthomonas hortorum pv. carotae]